MTHASGEMAEWSNAAVLKTVEGNTSGGSNPSLSARKGNRKVSFFLLKDENPLVRHRLAAFAERIPLSPQQRV